MNKQERLKTYKKALSDYRKAYYFGWLFLKAHSNTSRGFCYYFATLLKNDYIPMEVFPELSGLKPAKEYEYNVPGSNIHIMTYWLKPGDRKSRINLLKKAIKLTK